MLIAPVKFKSLSSGTSYGGAKRRRYKDHKEIKDRFRS
jgi:hypothetical protein